MKRSRDLPLTIRPVVGMSDHYPAGFVDTFHRHDHGQLTYATSGIMTVVTDTSAFLRVDAARAEVGRPVLEAG